MEYRRITSENDLQQIEKLLNESYGVIDGSFFDDFPVWNHALNVTTQKLGTFEDKALVGFAGIRYCDLKSKEITLPVAMIGGVSTHLSYRGQGIATELTQHACREAAATGASAVFLWGSEHELYRKLGFELCGIQLRGALKDLFFQPKDSSNNIRTGWNPKILNCAKQRSIGVEVKPSDHAWYSKHKHVNWRWIERDGEIGYIGKDRGIDLKGFIHEIGGSPNLVREILESEAVIHSDLQLIGSPEVFRYYGIPMQKTLKEYICMSKILRPNMILEKMGLSEKLRIEPYEGRWILSQNGEELGALDPKGLSRLFFGPDQISGLSQEISNHFPIPFWFWGLDSA